MSCLGNTVEDPRPWVRYRPDGGHVREPGRICPRTNPRTSRRTCAGCPAFRGVRWDGAVADGLAPDRLSPMGLSVDEHERYQEAVDAQLYDDDDELMFRWYARQMREVEVDHEGRHSVMVGIGEKGLRRIGDPDATDRWAARMRDYRKEHPGLDRRKRRRAAYMRFYRAQQAAERNP